MMRMFLTVTASLAAGANNDDRAPVDDTDAAGTRPMANLQTRESTRPQCKRQRL